MSEVYNPSEMFSSTALISSMDEYKNKYQRSLDDPDGFWGEEAEQFIWFEKWGAVRQFNYDVRKGRIFIEWFNKEVWHELFVLIERNLQCKMDKIILECLFVGIYSDTLNIMFYVYLIGLYAFPG